ncbi:hypothetical protein DRW42_22440 [Pedobacter miscanthi]|uniref:Uncharacterized protein n=1 Tax=Pedobacter miscanthi TaxID=2259170 RepID=A0A366KPA3_9SPHI|nr:hypothetical protein DRW42_22440 [Pedobacter miscanthi]
MPNKDRRPEQVFKTLYGNQLKSTCSKMDISMYINEQLMIRENESGNTNLPVLTTKKLHFGFTKKIVNQLKETYCLLMH